MPRVLAQDTLYAETRFHAAFPSIARFSDDHLVLAFRRARAGMWLVPEAKRVTLRIGSDDSCVVWLHGKRVHGFSGQRATRVDEDRVNVQLVRGTNRILVKVLNKTLGWAFCLRITDRQGG